LISERLAVFCLDDPPRTYRRIKVDKLANIERRQLPFEETLVNKRTVAAFLGMTESGFTKMIHRGEGPPYLRIGRLIRFFAERRQGVGRGAN
jgi:predicted DNA-binding transcriptional regulator AlpA